MMRACPICHTEQGLTYLWQTQIVHCPTCGLGYRDPQPTFEELAKIYADEAYFNGRFYADYVLDKPGAQLNFRRRLNKMLEFTPGGDALFEIGCAHGFFLELAQPYWKQVQGIDFSPEAAAYARDTLGLDVQQGDVETHPPAPNAFDAVVMWDAIEHLYDPAQAVQTSAQALRSGGLLALTTGDISALLPRLQKQSWRLILPQHLFYFSKQSLTWLFNANGLDVIHSSHAGYYRSLKDMTKAITWRNPQSVWRQRLRGALQRLPFMDAQIPLNLYDIIFIIGRKRT